VSDDGVRTVGDDLMAAIRLDADGRSAQTSIAVIRIEPRQNNSVPATAAQPR
jgi:hypothetical protein